MHNVVIYKICKSVVYLMVRISSPTGSANLSVLIDVRQSVVF